SYLLSAGDLQRALTHVDFVDIDGRHWHIVNPVRSHPDGHAFTIPSIAASERSLMLSVGLMNFESADGRPAGSVPASTLKYVLRPRKVHARPVIGATLGVSVEVRIGGSGECRVSPNGFKPGL
ncbi:MAG: hypothetical protein KF699_08635, partial [Phycisphaeraceae bacterium]|nr:hypothetical protein [Phycisphaeraceae bacterium]